MTQLGSAFSDTGKRFSSGALQCPLHYYQLTENVYVQDPGISVQTLENGPQVVAVVVVACSPPAVNHGSSSSRNNRAIK